jgi:hypothetical protein
MMGVTPVVKDNRIQKVEDGYPDMEEIINY